jgi:NTP pyrophosphatase (non-canonical NTP hydrolase)
MKDYVEQAVRTEAPITQEVRGRIMDNARELHAILGKLTEIGELADAFKKHIFYGKPLDLPNVHEEIGDGFWYDALLLDSTGGNWDRVQDRNIAKLKARYPDKFTEDNAINRDLDNERKVLEDNTYTEGEQQ